MLLLVMVFSRALIVLLYDALISQRCTLSFSVGHAGSDTVQNMCLTNSSLQLIKIRIEINYAFVHRFMLCPVFFQNRLCKGK